MYQWWFLNCHKCSTLVGGLDGGGGCLRQGSIGKFSVLFIQFCSEPQTALYKLSTNFFFKVKSQQFYMVQPNSSALLLWQLLLGLPKFTSLSHFLSCWYSPGSCVFFSLQKPHRKRAAVLRILHLRLVETPFHISCPVAWKHWATASTCQ